MEQHRRYKGAFVRVGIVQFKVIRVAKDAFRLCRNDGGLFQNVALLAVGNQCAHPCTFGLWITDYGFCKPCAQGFNHGVYLALRCHDPAYSSTFLTGFGRHFALHFLDKEIKLRRAWLCIRAKD